LAQQNFARILDRKATTIRLYLFISGRIYPLLLFERMLFGKAKFTGGNLSATILSVKFYGQNCYGHFYIHFFKDKKSTGKIQTQRFAIQNLRFTSGGNPLNRNAFPSGRMGPFFCIIKN